MDNEYKNNINHEYDNKRNFSNKSKNLFIIFIIVIIIIIIIGVFFIKYYSEPKKEEIIKDKEPELIENKEDEAEIDNLSEIINEVAPWAAGDESLNMDLDDDLLLGYEEINIYNTDPNNPDTDGDGYLDGEEVMKGYNPLGEGKL